MSGSGNKSFGGGDPSGASLPPASSRLPSLFVEGPHPATLPIETLLAECELRTQARGGPGGQHRNKTSSGVFLEHRPTGIAAEATERRSQAQNRSVASTRLRYRLAVACRTPSAFDTAPRSEEAAVRSRYKGSRLRLSDNNDDKPAVLAMVLNDLHAAGGQPSLVAKHWSTSTSAVVSLVRSHRPAWQWTHRLRGHHGRPKLK